MTESHENRYDAVPYSDGPYDFSHPRHMETMATLFSMEPVCIRNCRVLELGCAAGGNLIPQAVDLPEASFLGIDLSERQIEQGQETIRALGLENIELRQADILDIDEDWGNFDYIICHGIISWVPENVQDKILRICRENLVPNGVALVSYNTYPGWHQVQVVRDLMQYHITQFGEPDKQISEAMAALKFMAELSDGGKATGRLFAEELETLEKCKSGAYLFHDHLEPHNHPFYFHEFIKRANSVGLQYLSDVYLPTMLIRNYSKKAAETLGSLPIVQQEQYADFLQGRRFRRTLLCHQEVQLNRALQGRQMMDYHFVLQSPPAAVEVDIRNDRPCEFRFQKGALTTDNRMNKAAIMYLAEARPNYVGFDELHRTALERLNIAPDAGGDDRQTSRQILADCMMFAYSANLVRICLHPSRCTIRPGTHPTVGSLPRWEAARGQTVTNRFHTRVSLDPLCRYITRRLDGRHDRRALAESVREGMDSGELNVEINGKSVRKLDSKALSAGVDKALLQISQAALLVE